jgi:hypothetical protein
MSLASAGNRTPNRPARKLMSVPTSLSLLFLAEWPPTLGANVNVNVKVKFTL